MSDDNWDNESLDDFESDFDDFSVDPPKDTGRSPIERAASMITAGLGTVGKSGFTAVGKSVALAMPRTSAIANDGMELAGDVLTMKDEFQKSITPTIQSLKQTARKFLPKAKGLIPAKIYDKVDQVLEVEEDEDKSLTSEERLAASREEKISETLGTIFSKQQSVDASAREEGRLDKLIDRKVDDTRHQKSMSLNALSYGELQKQNEFTDTVFSAYLKKSIELGYKQLFAAKDTTSLLRALAVTTEAKLEEIKINTSLPDIQKQRKAESLKIAMRGKMADTFAGGIGKIGKRILDNVKTNVLDKIKSGAGEAANMGELLTTMQDMQEEMGGPQQSLMSKVGSFGLRTVGKVAGSRTGRKLMDVAQPILSDVEGAASNYKTKGFLKLEELKDDKSGTALGTLLDLLLPSFDKSVSTSADLLDAGEEPSTFDGLARQTLVEIIPGYLSKQLKQLTDIATGTTESKEMVYDVTSRDFSTVDQLRSNIRDKAFGDKEARTRKLGEATGLLKGAYDYSQPGEVGSFSEVNADIGRILKNLAYNTKLLKPEAFKEFADSPESPDQAISYIESAMDGVRQPKAASAAIAQALIPDGIVNSPALNTINDKIIDLMGDDKYRSVLPSLFDTVGYARFFKDDVDAYGGLKQSAIVDAQVDVDDTEYDKTVLSAGENALYHAKERDEGYKKLESVVGKNARTAKYAEKVKTLRDDPARLLKDAKLSLSETLSAHTNKFKRMIGATPDSVIQTDLTDKGTEQKTLSDTAPVPSPRSATIVNSLKSAASLFPQRQTDPTIDVVEDLPEKSSALRNITKLLGQERPGSLTDVTEALVAKKNTSKVMGDAVAAVKERWDKGIKRPTSVLGLPITAMPDAAPPSEESEKIIPSIREKMVSMAQRVGAVMEHGVPEAIKTSATSVKEQVTKMTKEAVPAVNKQIATLTNRVSLPPAPLDAIPKIIPFTPAPKVDTDQSAALPETDKVENVPAVATTSMVKDLFADTTERPGTIINFKDIAREMDPVFYQKAAAGMDALISLPNVINTSMTRTSASTISTTDGSGTDWGTGQSATLAEIINFKEAVVSMSEAKAEKDAALLTLLNETLPAIASGSSGEDGVGKSSAGGLRTLAGRGFGATKNLVVGGAKAYGNLVGGMYNAAGNVASAGLNLTKSIVPGAMNLAGQTIGGGLGLAGKAVGMYKDIGIAGFNAVSSIFGGGKDKEADPFISIYLKDAVEPSKPILSSRKQRNGEVIFEDGSVVEKSSDIVEPVYDGETQEPIITQEDLDRGLVDINNDPIGSKTTKLKLPGFGKIGSATKGGKGLLSKGFDILSGFSGDVLGMYGSMFKGALGAGGALLSKGKELLTKSSELEKEDLDPIVTRMDIMIDLMKTSKPDGVTKKKKLLGDTDGDGDVDGSYKDLSEKMKKKRVMRAGGTAGIVGAGSARGRGGGMLQRLRGSASRQGSAGNEKSSTLVEMAKYKALDAGGGFVAKAGRFMASKGGTAIKTAASLGGGALMAGGSAALSAGAAVGSAALTGATALGGAAIAGLAAIPVAGWIALGVGAVGYGAYKFFSKDGSKGSIALLKERMKYYGIPESVDVDDVRSLEDATYEIIQGKREPLTRSDMEDYVDDFGLDDDDERHIGGFKEWYQKKFIPLFGQFLMAAKAHGKTYEDMEDIDLDDPAYEDIQAMMIKSMSSAKVTDLTISTIKTPVTKKAKKEKAKEDKANEKAAPEKAPEEIPKKPTGKMALATEESVEEDTGGLWSKIKKIGTSAGGSALKMIPGVSAAESIIGAISGDQPTNTEEPEDSTAPVQGLVGRLKGAVKTGLSLTAPGLIVKHMINKFRTGSPEESQTIEAGTGDGLLQQLDSAELRSSPSVLSAKYLADRFKGSEVAASAYADKELTGEKLDPEATIAKAASLPAGKVAGNTKIDRLIASLDVMASKVAHSDEIDDKEAGIAKSAIRDDDTDRAITAPKESIVSDAKGIEVAKAVGASQVTALSTISTGINDLIRLTAASLKLNTSMDSHMKTVSEKEFSSTMEQNNNIFAPTNAQTEVRDLSPGIGVDNT